jgi:hypothetical protein
VGVVMKKRPRKPSLPRVPVPKPTRPHASKKAHLMSLSVLRDRLYPQVPDDDDDVDVALVRKHNRRNLG